MNRELIQRILADAPGPGYSHPDRAGWRLPNGLCLCARCAGRIMARGHQIPSDSVPLWRDLEIPEVRCAGCGGEVA